MKRGFLIVTACLAAICILVSCGTNVPPGSSSASKAITAYAFSTPAETGVVNETENTITVTVPYGTNITDLVAFFTTTGATVTVGSTPQVSGATSNDFTKPVVYTVTAQDGSTTQYTVTVAVALSSAKAITSYSILGVPATIYEGAKTLAVTLPFGTDLTALTASFTTTGAIVKVGSTVQASGSTKNNFTDAVVYTVAAADGSATQYTVVVTVASTKLKTLTSYSLLGIPASIDEQFKTITVTLPYGTDISNLAADFTTTGALVKVGSTVQISSSTANDFSKPIVYTVIATDGSSTQYTVVVSVALNPAKSLTSFSIQGIPGSIYESAKIITVPVPYGTDVTAMVASFTTTGKTVNVGVVEQISGTTQNDFTSPVVYTITAVDGSTAQYTVIVSAALNPAKELTSFAILGKPGIIDESTKTIAVFLPYGTDVTALAATFTTSGAGVKVGATAQVSGTTQNDFSNPVIYTVIAPDGTSTQYTVAVNIVVFSSKSLTSFAVLGIPATINESAKTVAVSVPYGTDLTTLTATFTTTGASVKVGSMVQISGTTKNDFTNAVSYTVIAQDGSTAVYTVRVSIQSYVHLQSDAGDYIGGGKTYSYTKADAQITLNASSGHLSLAVTGDQNWTGDFQEPSSLSVLQTGSYNNLTRYPFNSPTVGGLSWSGEGRGCNTLTGWFVIDSATYNSGFLSAIDLHFEQHCEGASTALRGQIHWTSFDTTVPTGPVNPPPPGLWQPVSGATPTSGNYVYLKSDAGDFIGQGKTYTYTRADALLTFNLTGNNLALTITGDQDWSADFKGPIDLSQLQPGYYGNLKRYPFNNPVRGGLSWYGEGRGCNTLTGWFVVDDITLVDGALQAIDLRFEQRCEGGTSALRGQIHWTSNDTTAPPGPVTPPPAGLWQPVSGATPTAGNYAYLASDVGDYIGAGQTYTYTTSNATLSAGSNAGLFWINISGSKNWSGNFKAMNTLAQLQPGYYGNLQRYPFNNPVRGGLSWYGDGRGCNNLTGWFVVDTVSYANGVLQAIDLRFEQHCEGTTPSLHGQIHWAQ
ncbi:MAG: hypothetical protein M0042_13175 [Nitrospiraceae bacterium]|nr:hypothetical protein [Nitrospiraceae bacterium]